MPASGDGLCAAVSSSVDRSSEAHADPWFHVINLIRGYGGYLDSRRFAAMHTNWDSASVCDVHFQHNWVNVVYKYVVMACFGMKC